MNLMEIYQYPERYGSAPRLCYLCGHDCQPALAGLYDDRFGIPGDYDILRCRCCSLEQIWPRPSAEKLEELYERNYNWGGEHNTAYTKIRERLVSLALYRLWLEWD